MTAGVVLAFDDDRAARGAFEHRLAAMSNWQTVGNSVWSLRLVDASRFFPPAMSL